MPDRRARAERRAAERRVATSYAWPERTHRELRAWVVPSAVAVLVAAVVIVWLLVGGLR